MGRLRSNIWLFVSGNQSISFEFAIKEWSCLPFCLLASVYLPLRCSYVKKVCQKCRPLSQLRNSIKMSRISNRTVIQWKLLNWISLQLRMQPNVMAIGGVRAKAQTHGIQDVVNVIRVDRRKIRLIIHSSSAISLFLLQNIHGDDADVRCILPWCWTWRSCSNNWRDPLKLKAAVVYPLKP